MSYKQAILRDDPISFWPLDGRSELRTYGVLLLEYPAYQDYINGEPTYNDEIGSKTVLDESNFGNHGAFVVGSPNFDDVTPLITHSSYDTNLNGCKIDENVRIDIFNAYGSFQKGYEHKTFGIEFWLLIPNPTETKSEILNLHNRETTSDKRVEIYVQEDFIYFTVFFSNGLNVTTKKQVYSWNQPIHVFALIKDGVINIFINGSTDESVSIPTSYKYYSDYYSKFNLGPSSTGNHFTINGLAFYDKSLTNSQILNHMFWGQRDSSPVVSSNQTDVSHFLFDNSSGQTIFSKQFINSSLYRLGTLSNIITDGTGLTLQSTQMSGSATGTWIYPLTLFSYLNFNGAEISWDSSASNSSLDNNYVIVEVSYDNGVTYLNVNNGKSFPNFLSNFSEQNSAQCLIKVTLYSSDTSAGKQPRIDNLSIKVYSSINQISDSGLFEINPAMGTSYMIKNNNNNIFSRSKNLGILFSSQDIGSNPGYAIISSASNSTYQTIEFWMSYNGAGSAVLDTGLGNADLYIDESSVLQNTVAGSTLYVNGIDRSSSSITISNGEVYHVVLVYPATKSSNIFLNGSTDTSKIPSEASYGYITIYPEALSLTNVKDRYLSFITVKTGVINDSSTSIGTLSEYSGTNTQINNGQALIYYTHIQ